MFTWITAEAEYDCLLYVFKLTCLLHCSHAFSENAVSDAAPSQLTLKAKLAADRHANNLMVSGVFVFCTITETLSTSCASKRTFCTLPQALLVFRILSTCHVTCAGPVAQIGDEDSVNGVVEELVVGALSAEQPVGQSPVHPSLATAATPSDGNTRMTSMSSVAAAFA